jgi:hypothetical protein
VIGSIGKYSEKSSICRAAIQSGVITDMGGVFTIEITKGYKDT